jgi:hypothetical protein
MEVGDGGKDAGQKKPYRKPTVESRGLKLGVYGDYGTGGSQGGPYDDNHRGGHRGGGNGHHGL